MELAEIRAFVSIVDMGSFVQAASFLNLSQPAISRRIGLLEKELGIVLFDRQPAGAILTEAGEAYLPFARRVLATIEDGYELMREFKEGAQGAIKLALVGTLASTDLTEKLKTFRAKYPDIRLSLRTARSSEVSLMVRSGETHLGLRYFDDENPTIHSQVIATERMVVVCANHAQEVNDAEIDVEELKGMSWVSFPMDARSSGDPFARLLRRQLTIAGLDDADMITIDSLTAQKRLIESGFGIGLLPISSIQEELHLGAVKILHAPTLETAAPVVLIYRKQAYLSQAVQNFLDEILAERQNETTS
ncbi:MAG: LysR family transcriptional regulator [Caldilineaceae bacterium]